MIKSRFLQILIVSSLVSLQAYSNTFKCEVLFRAGDYSALQKTDQQTTDKSQTNKYENYRFADIPKARTYIIPTPEIKGAITFSLDSIKKFEAEIELTPIERALLNTALNPAGYLGYSSSLGPAGTINKWGPVGTSIVNPSHLISGFDWSAYAKTLSENGGPLDANGVLGKHSANSVQGQKINMTIKGYNLLKQGSPLMILGPDGVEGLYSSLGALGPNGAHGFERDKKTGSYLSAKKQKYKKRTQEDTVKVNEETGVVEEELVELYTNEAARDLSEQHLLRGRFLVDGKTLDGEITDLNYSAKKGEWINFLVTPSGFGDSFSIQIIDSKGHIIGESKSPYLINFIVFHFAQDAEVKIRIKNEGRSPYYNAMVEGMQSYVNYFAQFNPFLSAYMKQLPPPVLTKTEEWRLHVITAPVRDEITPTHGPHWTQFK